MPCLFRYRWLKLSQTVLPDGKGLSAYWARLAARAAFRKGIACYCGHENPVSPGMWSGGVVGLKSILGVKKRDRALEILDQLASLGYLSYELNPETKPLAPPTPSDVELTAQLEHTSNALAMDMLLAKFIQGIPVVGIVGGLANPLYYRRIFNYVKLKCRKRYLLAKRGII